MTYIWMPESPYYLHLRGRHKEADSALKWLRGGATPPAPGAAELEKGTWAHLFGQERKALVLCIMIQASYILCGGTALFSYATETFGRTTGFFLTPDQVTIVMASTLLCLVPFSGMLADFQGRRPVLLISLIGKVVWGGGIMIILTRVKKTNKNKYIESLQIILY